MKHFLLIIAMAGCAATPRPPSIQSQKAKHQLTDVAGEVMKGILA